MRGRSPVEFQVYQLWYLGCHTEKIATERLDEVLEAIAGMFPGVQMLPRDEQIVSGRVALENALTNSDLLSDPRTESAS
jgi:hypothetical protein